MSKRLIDIIVSFGLLLVLLPVLLITAVAVVLSDPGPVFYRARRVGLSGQDFVMHKFRTMRKSRETGSAITSGDDPRVFAAGRIIRRTKLDELPQLWDVLRGKMSLVGPRPEDPAIVARHYTAAYRRTLELRPGLTSPGSIYYYSHLERQLRHADAESEYINAVLPLKMAIDLVYVDNQSVRYDLRIIGRTIFVIAATVCGRREFPLPPEYALAESKGYFNA